MAPKEIPRNCVSVKFSRYLEVVGGLSTDAAFDRLTPYHVVYITFPLKYQTTAKVRIERYFSPNSPVWGRFSLLACHRFSRLYYFQYYTVEFLSRDDSEKRERERDLEPVRIETIIDSVVLVPIDSWCWVANGNAVEQQETSFNHRRIGWLNAEPRFH